MFFFRPIISRWDTRVELAGDVDTTPGVVQQWWNRDSIPLLWLEPVAKAARKRRFKDITHALLLDLAKQRAKRRNAKPDFQASTMEAAE